MLIDLAQPPTPGTADAGPRQQEVEEPPPPVDMGWGGSSLRALPAADPRRVSEGVVIPALAYADQPYIVRTADGAWLCVLTTGNGEEGERGQHILSLRSENFGRTWSAPVQIEPPDGPESSWAVAAATPSGRIFVFYVHNGDDIRELPCGPGGTTGRMDSHGQYVFRWSDDEGRSWSRSRVTIPVREFEIDRSNSTGGAVRLFWNVGRPVITGGSIFLPLHKVGGFGDGWFTHSEGAFVRSDDLLSLEDPAKAQWETLPEGNIGLRTPPDGGPIAEEQCLLELSDGSFFCVYRSIDGYPVGSFSRDQGKTWDEPGPLRHADGQFVKHPRAACFAWRLLRGRHVLWFHNHGGAMLGRHPRRASYAYENRNPVWMCPGREIETPRGLELVWDNPEIALYDDDPLIRMSYPDLVEEGGRLFLSETQKAVARVHEVSPTLAHALRFGSAGFDAGSLAGEAALEWTACGAPAFLPMLPPFIVHLPTSPYGTSDLRGGFSIEIGFDARPPHGGAPLVQAWHPSFGGFKIEWTDDRRFKFLCSDGRTLFAWESDRIPPGEARPRHLIITVDGGPKVILFAVDGILLNGGDERQFGWGRFNPNFRGLPGGLPVESRDGISLLRIYPRALLMAEAGALHEASRC